MNGWGTDVLALACILGGAVVSGAVTVSALEPGDGGRTGCVAEVGAFTIPVVVAVDADVLLLDEARMQLEAARARSEVVRALIEEAWSRELQLRLEKEAKGLER